MDEELRLVKLRVLLNFTPSRNWQNQSSSLGLSGSDQVVTKLILNQPRVSAIEMTLIVA